MTKTIDEIYQDMRNEYTRATGIVLSDSGDMALRMQTFAAQLHSLWIQANWVRRQAFPQTANGEYLDYHARLRGLERGGATAAMGEIEFYLNEAAESPLSVPPGTVCLAQGGTEFVTLTPGSIPAGGLSCTVRAAAREAGSAGNVPAGSIVTMVRAPVGVFGCVNPMGFTGGEDSESDDTLRARVLKSYRRLPNGANAAFYEMQALSVTGVAKATVIPRANGIGTVGVYIASDSGMPSGELVAEVAETLGAQREICVDITVSAPEAVDVTVNLELEIESGHGFDDVAAAVRRALGAYFSGERLGENVLLARLGSIVFAVEGVRNYRFNLPASDIPISVSQLPVLSVPIITKSGD